MSAVYVLVGLVAYLIGSVSFAIIFSKKFAGFDVREKGSKNAGSTNVLRTVGKKAAALTLICDILKGVLAVLLAMLIVVFTFASCKKEKEPDSYYVDDEGNIETYDVTIENGCAVFETTHFSTYSLVAEGELKNPATHDGIMSYIVLCFISLVGIIAISINYKKRLN